MGLFSIFKRAPDSGPELPVAGSARDAVRQARARARHRLIGAVVLVAIGVIGFPLLFESTPRPIPVDIPIEIPPRDAVKPLVMPAARAPQEATAPDAAGPKPSTDATGGVARGTLPKEPAGATAPAPRTPDAVAGDKTGADRPTAIAPTQAPTPTPTPTEPGAAAQPATAGGPGADAEARAAEAARARALLEGRAPPGRDNLSFVVQVGAFADASSAQEVRKKVDSLGLKSFTQVTQTAQGKRVRVRLGPFASREEAEKVSAKVKAAGMNAAVMTP